MDSSLVEERAAAYTKKDFLYPSDLLEMEVEVNMILDGRLDRSEKEKTQARVMSSLLKYREHLQGLKNKCVEKEGGNIMGKMAKIAELREDRILCMISNLQLVAKILQMVQNSEYGEKENVEQPEKVTNDIVELLRDTMYCRSVYFEVVYKAYANVLYGDGQSEANRDIDTFLKISENYQKKLELMQDNILNRIYRTEKEHSSEQ